MNLASRLEAAATPGEILLPYEIYANLRHRIHCEERGHISVKGIACPVATYQVIDTCETSARRACSFTRNAPTSDSTLIST